MNTPKIYISSLTLNPKPIYTKINCKNIKIKDVFLIFLFCFPVDKEDCPVKPYKHKE